MAVGVQHATAGWQREARLFDLGVGGAGIELPPSGPETRDGHDARGAVAAGLVTADEVGIGDRVVLAFVAPTLWDPLRIPARVAWVRARTHARDPMRFGVSFEHSDPPSVLSLFELVTSLDYEA